MQNRRKLIRYLRDYVKYSRSFAEQKVKLTEMNRSFTTKEVKATGHTLYIENTFKFNEEVLMEVLNENIGSVAKKVILFGDNAYLWSTENGYEFFIEQSLPINEKNYDAINQLLHTYGTDTRTADALRHNEKLRNEKARKRSYIELAKRTGNNVYSLSNSRVNGLKRLAVPNGARTDGNTLANTQEQGTEQFFIGKKARTQFEQSLHKARPDISYLLSPYQIRSP